MRDVIRRAAHNIIAITAAGLLLVFMTSVAWSAVTNTGLVVQPTTTSVFRKAIIVGVGAWKNPMFPAVASPGKDAGRLFDYLTATGNFSVTKKNIILRTDDDAKKDSIIESLQNLCATPVSAPKAIIIIYLAGVVRNDGGDAYFAAWDSDLSRLRKDGISLQKVCEMLKGAKANWPNKALLIVDCDNANAKKLAEASGQIVLTTGKSPAMNSDFMDALLLALGSSSGATIVDAYPRIKSDLERLSDGTRSPTLEGVESQDDRNFSLAGGLSDVKKLDRATPENAIPEPTGAIADKWALVVGVGQFKDPNIRGLHGDIDARQFKQFLVDQARFAPDHVKVLAGEHATRTAIMDAILDKQTGWFPRVLYNPNDLVVVYVSTHGSSDDGKNGFLLAYDTRESDITGTGIPMTDLCRWIRDNVKTKRTLLVFDACYSGVATTGKGVGVQPETSSMISLLTKGTGYRVICSSSSEQQSQESTSFTGSIFTHFFLDALKKKNMNVKQACDMCRSQVEWEAIQESGKLQTPVIGGDWQGEELILSAPASEHRDLTVKQLQEYAAED